MKNKYLETLKKFFEKKEYIVCAYLFGSTAGTSFGAKAKPDIDIAILLDKDNQFKDDLEAKFLLQEEIAKLLNEKEENIDILILNSANSVITHEVFKNGKIIYEKDKEERIEFEIRKEHQYYDTKYLRRFSYEILKQWATTQIFH